MTPYYNNNNQLSGACCDASLIYNPFKLMTIQAQVIDFATGFPIEGVNIFHKNDSTKGTATNQNGVFSLEATPDDIIMFSHVAYQSIEIKAKDILPIEYLQESANALDEIVIVAKKNKKWLGLGLFAAFIAFVATRKEDKKPVEETI